MKKKNYQCFFSIHHPLMMYYVYFHSIKHASRSLCTKLSYSFTLFFFLRTIWVFDSSAMLLMVVHTSSIVNAFDCFIPLFILPKKHFLSSIKWISLFHMPMLFFSWMWWKSADFAVESIFQYTWFCFLS